MIEESTRRVLKEWLGKVLLVGGGAGTLIATGRIFIANEGVGTLGLVLVLLTAIGWELVRDANDWEQIDAHLKNHRWR